MRHLKSGRQLSRNSSHRWALMRNLITALLREEKIQTTDPKAKELRRWVDRVITLGKQGTLHARRQVLSIVQDKTVVRKLFDTIAPASRTARAATLESSSSASGAATRRRWR
jgi:large subunit ribosomal protein L17